MESPCLLAWHRLHSIASALFLCAAGVGPAKPAGAGGDAARPFRGRAGPVMVPPGSGLPAVVRKRQQVTGRVTAPAMPRRLLPEGRKFVFGSHCEEEVKPGCHMREIRSSAFGGTVFFKSKRHPCAIKTCEFSTAKC